jgi:hypothetical protein
MSPIIAAAVIARNRNKNSIQTYGRGSSDECCGPKCVTAGVVGYIFLIMLLCL